MKELFSRRLTWVCIIPLILSVIFVVYLRELYVSDTHKVLFDSFDVLLYEQFCSNLGDFMSGTIGVLFSLTATLFLFVTFYEQRQQVLESCKENQRARFEAMYFNMLSMLGRVLKSVDESLSSAENCKDLHSYYSYLRSSYSERIGTDSIISSQLELAREGTIGSVGLQLLKEVAANSFESEVEKLGCNLDYFYRYIYNTVILVYNCSLFNRETKKQYLNILKSQLPEEALGLLFYDVLSANARNKKGENKFFRILDELCFFENISCSTLFDRCHYQFYPYTKFLFLSRDELMRISER